MGYRDAMTTSAPRADPPNEDGMALHRLVEEQAALRRVATLVASGAPSAEVFSAVAQEVAQVLRLMNAAVCRYDEDGSTMTVLAVHGVHPDTFGPGSRWPLDGPSMSAEVLRTGRAVRIEEYADLRGSLAAAARDHGFSRVAGAPIIVDGRVWGLVATSSPDAPLPDDVEDRLAEFTDLVATAIANSEAHEQLEQLADQQAALRRVATLVAAGAPPAEVFEAVSAEVAALIAADGSAVTRYEPDGAITTVSGWTPEGGFSNLGIRYPLEGSVSGLILETGRPARIDNYAQAPGEAQEAAREMGFRSAVGAPLTVDGRLWGVLAVASKSEQPLPRDTEQRLAEFAELFATAIANSEAHEQLEQLADEQAALRRVATLVAEGATPQRVFDAVRQEVARMFNTPVSMLMRYDDANGTATLVTTAEGFLGPAGRSWPVEDDSSATAQVCRTGLPARADYTRPTQGPIAAAARAAGGRSAVGVPVVVQGALWGVVTVGTRGAEPLPADVEGRLAKFTELLATAIARSEAHEQLALLADEQAALRRVATLVAEGATPHRVFDAVRGEVARMFNAPLSGLLRYDGNGTVTQLAASEDYVGPIERSWTVEGDSAVARVCRTGLPARADYTRPTLGSIAVTARSEGVLSAVGVPVVVDGSLWGVMAVGTRETEPLPADFEGRLAKFTGLLATAIANAEGRAEVDASRARIVATADATRRRIERNLHDGAQQQLVSLALALRAAQATVPAELEQHRSELGRVVDGLTAALDDLREIALGIHPAGLSEDGLTPALKRLVALSPLRVNLDCRADGRFPEPVEVAAYYVVSEALTNAVKYADTPVVDVTVAVDGPALRVEVRDDGRGGADPAEGSGLLGLRDRVEAIGGTIRLTSPPGAGTSLRVELPLAG
jgi:signal transduction histidine kinase